MLPQLTSSAFKGRRICFGLERFQLRQSRERQQRGQHSRILFPLLRQQLTERLQHARLQLQRRRAGSTGQHQLLPELLTGVPASESIVIPCKQGKQVIRGLTGVPGDRRRKITEQRENRGLGCRWQALHHQRLSLLIEHQQAFLARTTVGLQCGPEHGNHQRQLLRLPRRGSSDLLQREGQASLLSIPLRADRDPGCSGLVIPTAELIGVKAQILTIGAGSLDDGGHEIFRGGGFTVMTFEIEAHSLHEPLGAQQRAQHADQFCTFFIDRCGVEIINRLVRIRLHRMRGRPGIFSKLRVTQHRCILDPFQCLGVQIRGETLISENGEALLQ